MMGWMDGWMMGWMDRWMMGWVDDRLMMHAGWVGMEAAMLLSVHAPLGLTCSYIWTLGPPSHSPGCRSIWKLGS